jgi:hypothetical protein
MLRKWPISKVTLWSQASFQELRKGMAWIPHLQGSSMLILNSQAPGVLGNKCLCRSYLVCNSYNRNPNEVRGTMHSEASKCSLFCSSVRLPRAPCPAPQWGFHVLPVLLLSEASTCSLSCSSVRLPRAPVHSTFVTLAVWGSSYVCLGGLWFRLLLSSGYPCILPWWLSSLTSFQYQELIANDTLLSFSNQNSLSVSMARTALYLLNPGRDWQLPQINKAPPMKDKRNKQTNKETPPSRFYFC